MNPFEVVEQSVHREEVLDALKTLMFDGSHSPEAIEQEGEYLGA